MTYKTTHKVLSDNGSICKLMAWKMGPHPNTKPNIIRPKSSFFPLSLTQLEVHVMNFAKKFTLEHVHCTMDFSVCLPLSSIIIEEHFYIQTEIVSYLTEKKKVKMKIEKSRAKLLRATWFYDCKFFSIKFLSKD